MPTLTKVTLPDMLRLLAFAYDVMRWMHPSLRVDFVHSDPKTMSLSVTQLKGKKFFKATHNDEQHYLWDITIQSGLLEEMKRFQKSDSNLEETVNPENTISLQHVPTLKD